MIASSVISMVDPVDGLIALLGYFFTILAALIIHFLRSIANCVLDIHTEESLQVYVRLV